MGRYIKEKQMPMRVTCTEKNSLLPIFKNISNLKEAEEKYHRISILEELSREEIDEAKENKKARTDKYQWNAIQKREKNTHTRF